MTDKEDYLENCVQRVWGSVIGHDNLPEMSALGTGVDSADTASSVQILSSGGNKTFYLFTAELFFTMPTD